MSKVRKAKKLRQPNVPVSSQPTLAVGGGTERAGAEIDPAVPDFDYTTIKKDLTRIGILAGSFIAILVVLSFIIR